MERIAITGGAGFVGTNLIHALVKEGFDVVAIDDFSTGLKSNLTNVKCKVNETNILDKNRLLASLVGCDYIFHLAARGSIPRSIRNPRATMEVNVTGTLNVLECARELGARVAFSSSSSVYGSNSQLPKSEEMWTGPLTPYAASKLAGEGLVESYQATFGVSCVNYRFFNIFGPWQRPDHDYAAVIPKWIWRMLNEEPLEVYGDGTQSRDFTYVDDVVSILLRGMKEQLNHPRPLNVAFGTKISLNQVIDFLKDKSPRLEITLHQKRQGDVMHSQNNPKHIREIFPDFIPTDFEKALESTFNWFVSSGLRIANGPEVVS